MDNIIVETIGIFCIFGFGFAMGAAYGFDNGYKNKENE